MSDTWFLFVPHDRAKAYQRLGWEDCGPSPGSHGEHSRVMKFESVEEPPIPLFEEAAA